MKKKAGLAAGLKYQLSLGLEVKPQRQLGYAVTACAAVSASRLPEGTGTAEISLRHLEVRMVEQVEEVGIEPEARPLVDFEGFANAKIHVGKVRSRNCAPTEVGVAPVSTVGIDIRIVQAIGTRAKLGRIQIHVFMLVDGTENAARADEFRPVTADAIGIGIARRVAGYSRRKPLCDDGDRNPMVRSHCAHSAGRLWLRFRSWFLRWWCGKRRWSHPALWRRCSCR